MRTGVIAKKLELSRIFKDDGSNIPVTVLQMDNCTVIQKKVENLDGYNAVSVSFGKRKKMQINRLLDSIKKIKCLFLKYYVNLEFQITVF